jgi:hypothetical protein
MLLTMGTTVLPMDRLGLIHDLRPHRRSLRRAAEWVGARDRSEMIGHWQRVRALLDTLPESSETLAMGVLARTHPLQDGMLLGQADDEAAALFAEGMALPSRLDGPAARIVLLSAYGTSRFASGAMDEALAHRPRASAWPTSRGPVPVTEPHRDP